MGPLNNLRVIELASIGPGPMCAMLLADMGADVVRVDRTEPSGLGVPMDKRFEVSGRSRRSVALDLKAPAGRDAVLRLIDTADILIEGFRPGVAERLGLGPGDCHARNPRLVYGRMTGFGQSGPLAQAAGHDLNYIAMTGVLDQVRVDGEPAIPNLQMGDLLGGTLSALSMLLAALLAAQRTGQGRYVDVAMTDGLLAHHFFPHAELDAGLRPEAQRTLLTGGVACYRTYRAADGRHLAVGALEFKFWKAFCDAAGLPELVERHWTRGEAPGSDAARDTIARVAHRIAQKTAAEWEQAFAQVDCCVTPVLTPAEALAHPHHNARGLVRRQGDVTEVGPLAQVSGHRWTPAPAPAHGEHTRAILAECGFDGSAIDALVQSGVVTER